MTAPAPRRTMPCDKVVRFEIPAYDGPYPATSERGFLHALEDDPGLDQAGVESPGCILDFEYNGIPARNGFIFD